MAIEFVKHQLTARASSPDDSEVSERAVEVRIDPLLGTSARIAEGVKLQTADPAALEPLKDPGRFCPFCAEHLERVTPRIHPDLSDEPRIRVGEAVLFPNLVPYAQHAAVATLSSQHWLDLDGFTPRRLADNLSASIRYVRGVHAADPAARFAAWNVNYLYPSGGSLPHPHAQVYLDPLPTTRMRLTLDAGERYRRASGTCYWEDLVATERERGERFAWDIGTTTWLTPFAPIGFNEVRAVVRGRRTLLELEDADVAALAEGIARVLGWYASLGMNSFNLTLLSGPLDGSDAYRLNVTMVTRTALVPYYRSDAMVLERLHWEAAVDRTPEANAAALRPLAPAPAPTDAPSHPE